MAGTDVQLQECSTATERRADSRVRTGLDVWLPELRRLSIGAAGPVAVAGTQFSAALLLWGHGSARAFGLFSLLMVVVQLSQGLSNALVGTPLSVAPHDEHREQHREACLAANGLLLVAVAVAVAAVFWLAGAGQDLFAFVALAFAANLRWTARSHAIAEERVEVSALSDGVYAACTAAFLGVAVLADHVTLGSIVLALAAAHLVALAALSRDFMVTQVRAFNQRAIAYYRAHVWRQQAGWALVGVVSTEASSNTHAYVVTWQAGAAAFAPLAFGSLFCRPLSIFLNALTQIDRPLFARLLSENARDRVRHLLGMNFVAAIAVWIGNLAAAGTVLWLFKEEIAARGYDTGEIHLIVAIWLAIMAVRAARNPLATFIQASRAFRPLAFCSMASGAVSILAVLSFMVLGPTYSLLGILCGEALLLGLVAWLARKRLA